MTDHLPFSFLASGHQAKHTNFATEASMDWLRPDRLECAMKLAAVARICAVVRLEEQDFLVGHARVPVPFLLI